MSHGLPFFILLAEAVLHGTRDFVAERSDEQRIRVGARYASSRIIPEIRHLLAPYQVEDKPLTGDTVIYKDLWIDSLAVMDIIMESKNRFDISIPINVVAEIHTVE